MISTSVNAKDVTATLNNLQAQLPGIAKHTTLDVAYEAMRLSQIEVPHDEGTLQNSGTVEQVGPDVVIGYHTPYAARLHEHPEYHFQRGRKGKYLEDPLRRNAEVLGLRFTNRFGDGLGGLTK